MVIDIYRLEHKDGYGPFAVSIYGRARKHSIHYNMKGNTYRKYLDAMEMFPVPEDEGIEIERLKEVCAYKDVRTLIDMTTPEMLAAFNERGYDVYHIRVSEKYAKIGVMQVVYPKDQEISREIINSKIKIMYER